MPIFCSAPLFYGATEPFILVVSTNCFPLIAYLPTAIVFTLCAHYTGYANSNANFRSSNVIFRNFNTAFDSAIVLFQPLCLLLLLLKYCCLLLVAAAAVAVVVDYVAIKFCMEKRGTN